MSVSTTAPPGQGRRWNSIRPLVAIPAAVVLACVLIVRVPVLRQDMSYWTNVHGDSTRVYAPEGVYGDNWNTAQFEPFSGGRLGWREALLGVIAYGGTLVVGERILRVLVKRYRWPLALRLGGAFLIGYVPVFAVVRLVTLRVGTNVAPWLCLAMLATAAGVSLTFDIRARPSPAKRWRPRVHAIPVAVVSSAVAIVVWTIESGRNYLVSDSVLLFLGVAAGDAGPLDWLPPFGRQMDEFLFNYPMVYAFRGSSTFALWFWLTDAFAKVAMVWLIIGVVWTLTKGRWLIGALASGLVLFASPLADPTGYVSLFGGQNPAIYLGHPGRFLGILLPFLVILVMSEGTERGARWVCAGFGLALMATSPHNVTFAAVVGALLALIVGARRVLSRSTPRVRRGAAWFALFGVIAAVAGPLVTYATIAISGLHGMGGLFLVAGVAGALAATVAIAGRGPPEKGIGLGDEFTTGHPGRLIPLGLGVVVGLLTMGNIFYKSLMSHSAYRSMMRFLFPAYRQDPLYVLSFHTKLFTRAACVGVPSPACGSFSGFVSYFGPTFLAGVAALVVVLRSRAPASLRQRDLVLVLLQFALLEIGMFLTDFMGATDPGTYWVQTRFLEVGYYGILIMLPVVLWNHLSGEARRISLAIACVWFVVPLVVHPFAPQWWDNLVYLVRAV